MTVGGLRHWKVIAGGPAIPQHGPGRRRTGRMTSRDRFRKRSRDVADADDHGLPTGPARALPAIPDLGDAVGSRAAVDTGRDGRMRWSGAFPPSASGASSSWARGRAQPRRGDDARSLDGRRLAERHVLDEGLECCVR